MTDPDQIARELLPCPFMLGERVRIRASARHDWTNDHARVDYFVIGMALTRSGELRVHVSEDWPKDGGMDDVDPDLLERMDSRPQVAAALMAERDACEAELKEQRRQLLEGVIVIRDLVAERDSARNSGICAGLQIALDIAQERVENGPCGEYCRAACDIRAEIMGKGIPPFKTPERAAVGDAKAGD